MAVVDVPVLPRHEARPEMVAARNKLADAMDLVEMTGGSIPCKTDPESWTSDLLSFNSGSATMHAEYLAGMCLTCPALAECDAFADAAKRSRYTQLYGVVAGRLIVATRHIQINPRGNA